MMSSKQKLMFLIVVSLQLFAILSHQNDHKINGISTALHKMKIMSRKDISAEEPLYCPTDFIKYYINLSVGTPAQDILLMMDTSGSVGWAPCTPSYTCNNCHGYNTVFLPSKSSSAVPVMCGDPKWKELFGSIPNCSGFCPGYVLYCVLVNTTANLPTETLTFPFEGGGRREIKNFGVGCSVVSSGFCGIAGFGRGGLSMPSQLTPFSGMPTGCVESSLGQLGNEDMKVVKYSGKLRNEDIVSMNIEQIAVLDLMMLMPNYETVLQVLR